jgi:stage II sporulation protein P
MQNETELLNIIKETYPQNPRKEFVVETENKLRKEARRIKRKGTVRKVFAISSGVLLFTFAFSWLFLFSGGGVNKDELSNGEVSFAPAAVQKKNPQVFIYQTHNREGYYVENSNSITHETENIRLVGQQLKKALMERNIQVIHDETDFTGILEKQQLPFKESYTIARETVQEALKKHSSIEMVFDIHRDSGNISTVIINGESVAKIGLVVSKSIEHYEENKEFAVRLREKLETLYPGITRGVLEKGEVPKNSYNQDLHNQSVSILIGGTKNTMDEAFRAAEALAEAIKEIIEES